MPSTRTNAERQRRYIKRLKEQAAMGAANTSAPPPQGVSNTDRLRELEAKVKELEAELAPMREQVALAHRYIFEAEDLMNRKGRIVPAGIYKTILQSAHPDRTTDPKTKIRYETAFKFLKEHERVLAATEPKPKPTAMPRTAQEWAAAKHQVRQKRSAKAKAAKAAKAAKGRKAIGAAASPG